MRTTTRLALLGTSVALIATAAGATAAQAEDGGAGDITLDKVVVNGGKPVVVGTTKVVSFKVSVTASDDSGIAETRYIRGTGATPNFASAWADDGDISCVKVSDTTSTCTATLSFDPQAATGFVGNSAAGTWNLGTLVTAHDTDYIHRDAATTFKVQRFSRLTTNAAPEPVKKGRTITVTGSLTRANWDTSKYMGYTKQPVKLQFKKKGASTYSTVKTVTSSSTGGLKTTVTAATDGYWRYSFAGTSTTPAVNSTSDFVDVQ
ncbi:calcium-binding protein [Streptomyces sp. NPDC058686]|uniref:calcium-binding protein n=1 Tax=Streptomyces sp. NPDC058686 TaxID=3346599 RepID=UPI00365EBA3F